MSYALEQVKQALQELRSPKPSLARINLAVERIGREVRSNEAVMEAQKKQIKKLEDEIKELTTFLAAAAIDSDGELNISFFSLIGADWHKLEREDSKDSLYTTFRYVD